MSQSPGSAGVLPWRGYIPSERLDALVRQPTAASLFPRLPQAMHGTGIKWWSFAQVVLVQSVPTPPVAQIRIACPPPLHICAVRLRDPGPLGLRPPAHLVSGTGLHI